MYCILSSGQMMIFVNIVSLAKTTLCGGGGISCYSANCWVVLVLLLSDRYWIVHIISWGAVDLCKGELLHENTAVAVLVYV